MIEKGKDSLIFKKVKHLIDEEELTSQFNKMNLKDKVKYTEDDQNKAKYGDTGQANRLLAAKKK